MNVSVVLAKALSPAVEGRDKVDLGVPPGADVGDVIQTLLRLYPKLLRYLPSERALAPAPLSAFFANGTLYLFAPANERTARQAKRDAI